jgi:hypothetical protein
LFFILFFLFFSFLFFSFFLLPSRKHSLFIIQTTGTFLVFSFFPHHKTHTQHLSRVPPVPA